MDNNLESKVQLLLDRIDKLEQEKCQSNDTSKIIPALFEAQGQMPEFMSSKKGVHGYYRPLCDIWNDIRKIMQKNDLLVSQREDLTSCGKAILVTTIFHKSGQWICAKHLLRSYDDFKKARDVNQAYGGQLTYFQRYSLCAILAIYVDKDKIEEEGSEEAVEEEELDGAKWSPQQEPKITSEQAQNLETGLKGFPKLRARMLDKYYGTRDNNFSKMFANKFASAVKEIKDQQAIGKDID
jgi:hypothetical protein